MSPVTSGHDVEIVTPPSVAVVADAARVRQVLANLLSNAAKFAPPRTPIRVQVRRRAEGVELVVTDAGPGVATARAGELFASYARLGATGPGLGLGLYISRAVARAYGGELVLESSGRGATFVLRLPAAGRAPAGVA